MCAYVYARVCAFVCAFVCVCVCVCVCVRVSRVFFGGGYVVGHVLEWMGRSLSVYLLAGWNVCGKLVCAGAGRRV